MLEHTPYTYLLHHIPTNKFYYGVRFADECHPSDFWRKYFTSSRKVKKLINEYGIDSFEYEIRKTFNSKEAAIIWEEKVLRRLNLRTKSYWLNRCSKYPKNLLHSPKWRKEMSELNTGINNPMYGKTHTDDVKAIISKTHKGRKHSEETKEKLSVMKTGKPFSGYGGNTPETILKRAKTNTGKKRTEEQKQKMAKAQLNRKQTPETIEKRRLALIGKKRTSEQRARMSEAQKGRTFSKETKRKMSEAATGRIVSEETKLKLSESMKKVRQLQKFSETNP